MLSMVAHCLVVLAYSFYCTSGVHITEITITVTAITDMVRGWTESVPLDVIVGQTTLNAVRHLVEKLTTFASHFATNKWGGKHGFLPLVLSKASM